MVHYFGSVVKRLQFKTAVKKRISCTCNQKFRPDDTGRKNLYSICYPNPSNFPVLHSIQILTGFQLLFSGILHSALRVYPPLPLRKKGVPVSFSYILSPDIHAELPPSTPLHNPFPFCRLWHKAPHLNLPQFSHCEMTSP